LLSPGCVRKTGELAQIGQASIGRAVSHEGSTPSDSENRVRVAVDIPASETQPQPTCGVFATFWSLPAPPNSEILAVRFYGIL
jgi:hypothetical protein